MEENKAETTQVEEVSPAVDANAGTDTSDPDINTAEFTDGGAESSEGAKSDVEKPVQSAEQNREYAKRRREAEAQKKRDAEIRTKAIIDAMGGKNPYTGDTMKDATDVDEYLIMKQIESEGGDPTSDYHTYRKRKDREAADAAKKEAEDEAWFAKDRSTFEKNHPDVSLDELFKDEDFITFADGKLGKQPLSKIYDGYKSIVGKYEGKVNDKAKELAAQALANRNTSPGNLGTSSEAESDFFTADQVRKMSREDIHKNYEKIRKSMSKW
jgi:hypothetical protein